MRNDCYYDIKGASLLLVVDNANNTCDIKLIDLASVCEYENKE